MKSLAKKLMSFLIPLLVFSFFAHRLINNWTKIKEYNFSINWAWLLTSLILLNGVVIFSGYLWYLILKRVTGKKIGLKTAITIHIASWLLRYVPGKVGVVLGKIYWGNKKGISKKNLFITSAYEYTFLILSSFLVGIYAFYSSSLWENSKFKLILPFLIFFTFLPILVPDFFYLIFNQVLSLVKKKRLIKPKRLSFKNLISVLTLYLLNRSLLGFSFFLMIKGIKNLETSLITFVGSSFVLASIIGFLAFFSPGGLGVREGILTLLLKNVIPLEIAIMVSILARIWLTIGDGTLFLLILPQKKSLSYLQQTPVKNEKI